jgi:hypothetical protein
MANQDTDTPPNDPHLSPLQQYCQDDILKFCSDGMYHSHHGNLFMIYCLEENKSKLTTACNKYLGTTSIGGCDDDAQALCPDELSLQGIMNCLSSKKVELTEACLNNIQNASDNPWIEARNRLRHITGAITIISLAYLLIPLLVVIWASRLMWKLHTAQKRILRSDTMSLQLNKSPFVSHSDMNRDNISNDRNGFQSSWNISFLNISYWNHQSNYSNRCLMNITTRSKDKACLNMPRKKSLCSVTGQFRCRSVTAIMVNRFDAH